MDNFEELLRKHYENRSLSETKVEEILHSCQDARQAHRWKSVAIGAISVAAASLVALGVMLVSVTTQSSSASDEMVAAPGAEAPLMEHKLVAVRIHADRCKRSQEMAPIFADLQQEFMNEPVLFVTFDYSTKPALRQTQCLSRVLGLETIFKAHQKTGELVVATPNGEVRDVVHTDDGLLAAAESVRHCLGAGTLPLTH